MPMRRDRLLTLERDRREQYFAEWPAMRDSIGAFVVIASYLPDERLPLADVN